jgi:hypothetical protein
VGKRNFPGDPGVYGVLHWFADKVKARIFNFRQLQTKNIVLKVLFSEIDQAEIRFIQ